MSEEQRYWFEEVPEEQRYWFVVQWGLPPAREAEREAELPSELRTDLEEIGREVNMEKVFGTSRDEVREARATARVTEERMDAAGYAPVALSIPWWPEAENKWVHNEGNEYLEAPRLFTTREAAQEERRSLEQSRPESYLDLLERYEETDVNEAFDDTSPLRAMWIDSGMLIDKLEDADFLCVMVDGRLKLREDLIEDLKRDR